MSEPRVRRFSRFAILFHWMVGLPYMALLLSGGLILLQRAGLLPWWGAGMVESLHKWIGIGLAIVIVQGAFAAVVSGRLGAIRTDLADWIVLRPRDLLWLLMVPLNIFWPRTFRLPAVGRYNAGQKLHGLFILIALVGFVITGIVMILRPADLRAWVVHSWIFYAAAAFLAIHLFLALINRATRPALSGIFTGYVPRDYVQEHHPLVLDEPATPSHHAVVSWRALAGTWALALFAAAGLLHWYGPERAAQQVLRIQGQPHASISPGPLFAAHADDPRVTSCQACHQSLQMPPDQACLSCHSEIQTVMLQKQGFHGQLEGSCRECHSDHRGRDASLIQFDPLLFNHDRARFALTGEHRTLACDRCHVDHASDHNGRQFIGLTQSCVACHTDPHQASLGADCRRCHSADGWEGRHLVFDHNRDASFKIDAIHSGVACSSCHIADAEFTEYRLAAKTCETCHATIASAMAGQIEGKVMAPDPHTGRVQCTDCHSTDIHEPTPAKYAARCQECHNPRYRGLYFDWQRSIEDRSQAAREAIKLSESSDPARFKLLTERLHIARKVGIHNTQGVTDLLGDMMTSTHPPERAR